MKIDENQESELKIKGEELIMNMTPLRHILEDYK